MPKNIPQIFTKETCAKMKAMDVMERRAKLAGVITAFFQGKHPIQTASSAIAIAQAVGVDQEIVNKVVNYMIQKGMTGPSDAPDLMNRNQPITAGVFYTAEGDPAALFGFDEIYDFVDMRNAGQTSFDILDVNNLITFEEKKSGQRMKVYGVTSGKASVSKMTIAAAIGIEDDWINYNQFWNLNQAIVEAQSKYLDRMASDHYAAFKIACEAHNVTFDTSDIKTINKTCATIFSDLAGLGYVLTGNERFVLRANPLLKERVEYAMATTFNSPNTEKNQIVHNVDRAYSTKLPSTKIYVGLPGRKAKRGVWADLSAETDRDILLKGTDVAYSGDYNLGIGETKQFRELNLS